ncbi:hypothetical protein BDV95DRAFT_665028 [Massariosphaeria phaeospora]|uniref:Uncharacterized protein n=1 Tax=Massariosphaeria phaeospora TaxID=100035 RepID=A0A7C8IFF9_9PLEO|nr:hypothetical protein BDV95DRAFT_665028 [Massariosphaeria phaeospora]
MRPIGDQTEENFRSYISSSLHPTMPHIDMEDADELVLPGNPLIEDLLNGTQMQEFEEASWEAGERLSDDAMVALQPTQDRQEFTKKYIKPLEAVVETADQAIDKARQRLARRRLAQTNPHKPPMSLPPIPPFRSQPFVGEKHLSDSRKRGGPPNTPSVSKYRKTGSAAATPGQFHRGVAVETGAPELGGGDGQRLGGGLFTVQGTPVPSGDNARQRLGEGLFAGQGTLGLSGDNAEQRLGKGLFTGQGTLDLSGDNAEQRLGKGLFANPGTPGRDNAEQRSGRGPFADQETSGHAGQRLDIGPFTLQGTSAINGLLGQQLADKRPIVAKEDSDRSGDSPKHGVGMFRNNSSGTLSFGSQLRESSQVSSVQSEEQMLSEEAPRLPFALWIPKEDGRGGAWLGGDDVPEDLGKFLQDKLLRRLSADE